jgi:hypothetical protein
MQIMPSSEAVRTAYRDIIEHVRDLDITPGSQHVCVAGYAVRVMGREVFSCSICNPLLTTSKNPDDHDLLALVDRGGLIRASPLMSELVARGEALMNYLEAKKVSDSVCGGFFNGGNQLFVFTTLVKAIVEPRTTDGGVVGDRYTDLMQTDDCPECKQDRGSRLSYAIRSLTNILMNNYCKRFKDLLVQELNSKSEDKDRSSEARKSEVFTEHAVSS